MRFLADEMLKKTAKWLRLIGYDTEFFEGNDTAVLAEAKRSGRILLTKDVELAKRAEKIGIPFLFLKQEKLEEDLAIIIGKYDLEIGFPEKTRCPECNGKLEKKECASLDGIPADVVAEKRKCWKCPSASRGRWA